MNYRSVSDLPSYPPEIPPLDSATYRLAVGGAVANSLELSLADLERFPRVTVTADFACLEGWVAANRSWQGVALAAVLAQARPLPEAKFVVAYAADHQGEYNVLLTLEEALRPTSLLALARDGQILTHGHGAPVRLEVPGADCFTQAKWVVRLDVLAEPVAVRGKTIALDRLQRLKAEGKR